MASPFTKALDEATSSTQPNLTISSDLDNLHWKRTVDDQTALISTSPQLLDLNYTDTAFSSDEMSWARSMSRAELEKMIKHSLTFGLYLAPSSNDTTTWKQVGIARLITDHVTFAYLTDVYISPEARRSGYARWLMACVREVMAGMTAIRRGMLVTGLAYGAEFYKETLGFYDINEEREHLVALTGRFRKAKQDVQAQDHS